MAKINFEDPAFQLYVERVVAALISSGARRATQYLSPKEVVSATRKRYDGKLPGKHQPVEIVLSFRRPNHADRRFIKACKKAGEPFPVRKIKLTQPRT